MAYLRTLKPFDFEAIVKETEAGGAVQGVFWWEGKSCWQHQFTKGHRDDDIAATGCILTSPLYLIF